MTGDPWNAVRAARLPAAALPALAPLRHRTDVRVFLEHDSIWVRWSNADADTVQALLPVAGIAFFVPRDGRWHSFQSRLPTADTPPEGDGCAIVTLLSPESFEVAPPVVIETPPLLLRLVPGGQPATASALSCKVRDLASWADRATTMELQSVRAARCGSRMILLGRTLPSVPGSVRYWGDDFFLPLGFRAEPELPVAVLRSAVGASNDDLVFLDESGAACVPRVAFQPLSRAALKLAVRRGGAA
jgi:hypothetical protein